MSGVYMSGVYMSGVYMSGVYMSSVYMSGIYMSGVYMSGAYMSAYQTLHVAPRLHVVQPRCHTTVEGSVYKHGVRKII